MKLNMKNMKVTLLTFWVCLAKQNFTLVIKYFSVATAFVFYCDAKHSEILRGPVMFVVTCF